jgi:hypothetical protein
MFSLQFLCRLLSLHQHHYQAADIASILSAFVAKTILITATQHQLSKAYLHYKQQTGHRLDTTTVI